MTDDPEQPDFGPGGYLPRRAAQRARKIVLREQMGMGWPLAAVAAAVVVALVGVVFLLTRGAAPEPPYVAVTSLAAVEADSAATVAVDDPADDAVVDEVLVVRTGGVRVFVAPDVAVTYCAASRRLEAPGLVWNLRGRLVGGDGESLAPLPTLVHDDQIYVDPTSPGPVPAPSQADEAPACAG